MDTTASQIIIYTGDGKGKTTAALGHAVAAVATGGRAVVVQFLKGGGYTGELFAQCYLPNLTIRQFGHGCAISAKLKSGDDTCRKCGVCFRENRNPARGYAGQALEYAAAALESGEVGLLVLDEVSHAIRRGLVPADKIVALLAGRPAATTVVLTGRNMPGALIALADRVTECRAVKHPLAAGIDARRGSEY